MSWSKLLIRMKTKHEEHDVEHLQRFNYGSAGEIDPLWWGSYENVSNNSDFWSTVDPKCSPNIWTHDGNQNSCSSFFSTRRNDRMSLNAPQRRPITSNLLEKFWPQLPVTFIWPSTQEGLLLDSGPNREPCSQTAPERIMDTSSSGFCCRTRTSEESILIFTWCEQIVTDVTDTSWSSITLFSEDQPAGVLLLDRRTNILLLVFNCLWLHHFIL